MFAKLIAVSSYLPKKIMSNEDMTKIMDTTDEWIVSRTGIKNRHWAEKNETTADLGIQAVKRVLEKTGLKPEDFDAIIVSTASSENRWPSVSNQIHGALDFPRTTMSQDIYAACTGSVYGMSMVSSMIKSGDYKRVLFVSAEKMTNFIDLDNVDRGYAPIFADGAGAMVFEATEEEGIMDSVLCSDGKLGKLLSDKPIDPESEEKGMVFRGLDVFKHAINDMPEVLQTLLNKNNLTFEDIDLIVPHQANQRIIDAMVENYKIPVEKVVSTIEHHGNTSSASIIIALDEQIENGRAQKGDLIAFTAFGAGFTWGALLLRL
ncbi:MAG: ketoacyl-ACP synthase III [Alphaproteobacteria bacterium]|nr:ketoacyl-ACP synthase III [Alphaproteobacteria bacterium]